MVSRRQRKVSELLHEELSQIIQYDVEDPRLGFVTVTGVEVSPDLQQARVYVSVLGDKTETAQTLAGLASASGYFRRKLSETVSLRRIPELTFRLDNTFEQGLRVDNLLDAIKQEEEQAPAEDDDETGSL